MVVGVVVKELIVMVEVGFIEFVSIRFYAMVDSIKSVAKSIKFY